MADIFLSYKKEDRAVAAAIVAALREAGKSVWWDDALNPKQAWDAMIEKEIAEARKVLVLWSPRSVKSDWVRSEAHYAQDHHKLVPVKIEECSLPLAFMLRQAVDLSSGNYSDANPEWLKLLAWIDGAEPEPAADAAAPAPPAKQTQWLNPARKKGLMLGLAIVAVLAIAAALWTSGIGRAAPQPDVIVDAFEVRSEELPASFASSLNDEMSADFSASSRISPKFGDGARNLEAYQLGGNVETDEENVRLFTRIFAPGIEEPVLTTRIETERKYAADAPRILGSKVARLVRCIATASDSTGSEIVKLPEAAIKPWAKFCQQLTVDLAASETKIGTLEDVIDAAPDFANAWSNLAETRLWTALSPQADRAAVIASAGEAADRALKLDEKSAKALAVKAMIAMGVFDQYGDSDANARFGDLMEWEKLAEQSVAVRQSDCGCEGPQFAGGLQMVGRASEGLTHLREAVDADPRNMTHRREYADMLSSLGRYDAANKALDELEEIWPPAELDGLRYSFAIANGRFDDALKLYRDSLDGKPEDPRAIEMLEALKSKDQARMDKVLEPYVQQADKLTDPSALYYLAHGNKIDALKKAARSSLDARKLFLFRMLWSPTLRQYHRSDEFAALVEQVGLVDYWKKSGEKPDICQGNFAAELKFCAAL
ncbi:toll/interleukin-1 receptor domain-containing protein [Sphingomicrobium flavum]|uniref:toll/interleukin-1 receptor domain-containing protein n=1 Tax=Sphingomicrobium flavum TaxID=1229164 RepID=UPI0021AD7CE7|nr:toll/interleukin-1 receptor domain-containing protein [Sphingomicrobium flavum]